jgi:hypothetical protein
VRPDVLLNKGLPTISQRTISECTTVVAVIITRINVTAMCKPADEVGLLYFEHSGFVFVQYKDPLAAQNYLYCNNVSSMDQ